MIRIGIVGDIGSGKSYLAKQFGFPVFNADLEVAKIYRSNRLCFKKIKKALPKYFSSFPIKKDEITKAILEKNNNLKKITRIIHPEVRRKMNIFLRKNKKKDIVVLDIPLLLENRLNKKKDVLIFIDAKKSEILKRLKKKKKFNLKLFKSFKKIQLPVEYKKKKSQFILKNNFTNKFLKKGVKRILKEIL